MRYLIILCFLVTGCAVPAYQKEGANGTHRTGYSETKITNSMYRVRYLDVTSDKAYVNFLKRAAELTIQNGYSHFSLRDVGGEKENGPKAVIGYGIHDLSLSKYEATVVFEKNDGDKSYSAKEILAKK